MKRVVLNREMMEVKQPTRLLGREQKALNSVARRSSLVGFNSAISRARCAPQNR